MTNDEMRLPMMNRVPAIIINYDDHIISDFERVGMLAVAIDSKKIPKGEVMIGKVVIHLDDLRCVDQVTMC